MSYGRRGNGLPGQSGGGNQPKQSPSGGLPGMGGAGRKILGGKAGGGGMILMLIIGAVGFMLLKGMAGNQGQQNGPNDGIENERTDRSNPNDRDLNRQPIDIVGSDRNKDIPQNDEESNREGWSMKDVDGSDVNKKKNQFNFSGEAKKEAPESDKVEQNGWEMKDADGKNSSDGQFRLGNETKKEPASDKVEKGGWELKDAKQDKKGG